MKLLQELFANGIITENRKLELEKEMAKTGKTEEDLILEKKIVSEDALFQMKSKVLGIPLVKTRAESVPADVLELISEEAEVNYKLAPLARKENMVQVGMVYPEDIVAQNALRFLAQKEHFNYQVFLITLTNLSELLKQRRNISSETKKALDELNRDKSRILDTRMMDAGKLPEGLMAEEAPIIKMVLVILKHAVEGRASDIHIEPSKDKLTVRFRMNGMLYPSLFLPLKVHPSIVARIKILSGLKIDETRVPQDGRFSAKIGNQNIDFRVSTFPTLYGEKVELRVLDPLAAFKTFDDLGLVGRNFERVQEAIKKPYGLVFFTGPTGSGKTTTQYAILKILNKENVNVVTIEDPIEYSIDGVNQSQVKPEIGYTFANGLRQILRQDPNVIMVGEVRDEETASLVINAALTGHIVLSTLHTNSAVGVVLRLMDMGVRPFLIPSTVRLVISQRLIRLLCPKCKIKAKPTDKIKEDLLNKVKQMPDFARKEFQIPEPFVVYEAKGCQECGFTGYSSRTGIFEVLTMNDEMAKLIVENPVESEIAKAAQSQGMLSMEQEAVIKILNGETSVEEATRVSQEKDI